MASSESINIGFKRQENTSQLKQICIELVQDNNYHTNLKTKRHVQRMAEGVMAAEITQPANIGLQYIPRTSSSNVPRTSSKDPIPATSQSNFQGSPEMQSIGPSNLTFKLSPWDVHSRCPPDVLRTSYRGPSEYSNLDVPNFLLTFLLELIRLTKSILKHCNT